MLQPYYLVVVSCLWQIARLSGHQMIMSLKQLTQKNEGEFNVLLSCNFKVVAYWQKLHILTYNRYFIITVYQMTM